MTLTAHSTHALSYLWFLNGEPINGHHDQRITVSEAGRYTVMALGKDCNSDMSDPVEVVVDLGGEPMIVDMYIRNEPDKTAVPIGGIFTYQLLVVNNGTHTARDVVVKATLPENVAYENEIGNYAGQVTYHAATKELTWTLGDIPPGRSETLIVGVRAVGEGLAEKLAIVTHSRDDSNPVDNEALATVNVIALKIPNIFTPNGDGINDEFRIQGLELFPENRLLVFNRWGNEVYKANPYRGDWSGSNLGEGTYYYIFELRLNNGSRETFKGFVTIIRNVSN